MHESRHSPLQDFDVDAALRSILEGTATETGEEFFAALVKNLAHALKTHGAWVTEYLEDGHRLRALAFWLDGRFVPDYEYDVRGTPCERVLDQSRLIHFPENIVSLFPEDPDLQPFGAVSYMGVPLMDVDGRILGNLAVMDNRPMPEEPRAQAIFQIFAARAGAELQRLRAEAEVREREEKLSGLVDSAMDAIIEIDSSLQVTMMNAAAEKVFGCDRAGSVGQSFEPFLAPGSRAKLAGLIRKLGEQGDDRSSLWISGGLEGMDARGASFPAEATLSRSRLRKRHFYTLILRNVNDRLEAERKIRSLSGEAEYLRDEIRSLRNEDEIIGQSRCLEDVLRDVKEVAGTDATVLIMGETGTGKELIARAIHAASPRRGKPLIKVNCAAIPATLMESEFFGHEKGAFTGATQRREGRFALADKGTLFLDEIGELPLDLQSKLLRVLQEGEFEPVGSARTRKVDVRVIVATNRNLGEAVKRGEFREDLYYRINVFPLRIPPLRERPEDIGLLAQSFAKRFSSKMGRQMQPLTESCVSRLAAYGWPGNVRELENVIERAVITSREGRLNLDRALPERPDAAPAQVAAGPAEQDGDRVRSVRELQDLERRNIILALEKARWRISGETGAAVLLGMPPSTLSSRMRALRIKRPGRD